MFKRQVNVNINAPTRTEYVTREVVEHRAPTDDSVRLLKEFEEKAQAKLDSAVHVGDASFECVIHRAQDMMSDCTKLRAVFSLNGIRETAEHECRPESPDDERKAIQALRDKVAAVIASRMIANAFSKAKW